MKKIILICALLGILPGCASIVSKSNYTVAIGSTPDAANFIVKNKAGEQLHTGMTPETVILKSSSGYFKGEAYTINFTKAGYPQNTFTMTSEVDGWYFANILLGGLIGMLIVDPLTGAMYKLPESISVSLDGSSPAEADEITIKTIDNLSNEEKQSLVRIN